MTRDARHIALVAVLAMMLALAGGVAGWAMRGERIAPPVTDTIVIHTVDTLRIASVPDTVTNIVTRYVSVPVYIRDTDTIVEEVMVPIPIEHHFSRIGEVADVWFSGYQARIDSAVAYQQHTTEIVHDRVEARQLPNLVTLNAGMSDASLTYMRRMGVRVWVGASAGTTYTGIPTARVSVGIQF